MSREGASVVSGGDNRDSWAIFRPIRPSRADIIRRKVIRRAKRRRPTDLERPSSRPASSGGLQLARRTRLSFVRPSVDPR